MSTLWQNIQYKMLKSGSRANLLIGINVLIFLLVYIPATIEQLYRGFGNSIILAYTDEYLKMPAYLPKLLSRFWTPLTYMFMHAGFFHILFNMLWLYWMGRIFEEYLGNKRTIGLYILGGLTGALFFIGAYNILPAFSGYIAGSTIVGASAGVTAVIIATATLLPDYAISLILIGPVKLKWIALFYILIDFLGVVGPNAGGEFSHLGGALFGFVYIKQLQRGHDWIGAITGIFKSSSKLKVASKNSNKNSSSKPRQDEIDRILDKISQTGYESLNKQEKELLFRASKDNEG